MACASSTKDICAAEFQFKNFFLDIRNPLNFTSSQWVRFPDWLFKAWKVVLALYFISWLGVSLDHFSADYPRSKNDKWMVYLTHWTYLLFTSYLVISAVNACCKNACGRFQDTCHLWALKFQWLLWNIAAPATTVVVLLYWSILWPHSAPVHTKEHHVPSVMNMHVHLLNGLILLLDQAIHAIPMRLLHVYQPVGYGAVYAAFTGVYFAANGTDPTGQIAIYSFLNYRSNTNIAIAADFGVIFIVLPAVWLFLWLIHQLRDYIWRKYNTISGGNFQVNPAFEDGEKEGQTDKNLEGVYTVKL